MKKSKFHLGVNELAEQAKFNIYQLYSINDPAYQTWFVTSSKEPSLFTLSDGTFDNVGQPSDYCLDLGNYLNGEGYNFLSIVDCSKVQHKFKYGESHPKAVDIYLLNNDHLKDGEGFDLCLYYSMTPRISRCDYINDSTNENAEHLVWDAEIKGEPLDTITSTIEKTTTIATTEVATTTTNVNTTPEVTTTTDVTATTTTEEASVPTPVTHAMIKVKGTMRTSKFYLGVNELAEQEKFDIYQLNNMNDPAYQTWFVTSITEPSIFTLSSETSDSVVQQPSNYCLDLGHYVNGEGYNFLSIVDCSKVQHKFKYG